MNLLEHYILEVYSTEDITEKFKERCGYSPRETMLSVKARIVCYGKEEDIEKVFFLSEWEEAQKQGYYMA